MKIHNEVFRSIVDACKDYHCGNNSKYDNKRNAYSLELEFVF